MSSGIGVVTAQRDLLSGDRRGAIPRAPTKSRRRAAAMRSTVELPDRPRALEAAHYAGITVNRLIAVKERTLGVSPGGRLIITLPQVYARLRELLLIETGYDVNELPEESCFPPALNPATRMGLQVPIQSTFFCEVKCRVSVKALRDAHTPEEMAKAIWSAIPIAHRSGANVTEVAAEAVAA